MLPATRSCKTHSRVVSEPWRITPGVRGPGFLSVNMSATKTVKITEGKTFTLRADAVNVLNKPQWGNPNTNVNGANFGRITTATGNRTVTLNARIDF